MAKIDPYARFQKASTTYKQRLIWAGFGEPGSGKTTFGLTAPAPIVIQSFDMGLEGVVEPFAREKDIYVVEYDLSIMDDIEPDDWEGKTTAAREIRTKFEDDFNHAITVARTVLWDKESDQWDLMKYAEFGPEAAAKPKEWGELKDRCRRLLNKPKATDINFGVIQSMRHEWVPSVNKKSGVKGITQSGNRIRAGMDDVEALVHINIEHERRDGRFYLKVGKSRGPGAGDVQDQEFESLTFVEFASLVFPDSREEDWQ